MSSFGLNTPQRKAVSKVHSNAPGSGAQRTPRQKHRQAPYNTKNRVESNEVREAAALGVSTANAQSGWLFSLWGSLGTSLSNGLLNGASYVGKSVANIGNFFGRFNSSKPEVKRNPHPISMLDPSLHPHRIGCTPAPAKAAREKLWAEKHGPTIRKLSEDLAKLPSKSVTAAEIDIYVSDSSDDETADKKAAPSSPLTTTAHPSAKRKMSFDRDAKIVRKEEVIAQQNKKLAEASQKLQGVYAIVAEQAHLLDKARIGELILDKENLFGDIHPANRTWNRFQAIKDGVLNENDNFVLAKKPFEKRAPLQPEPCITALQSTRGSWTFNAAQAPAKSNWAVNELRKGGAVKGKKPSSKIAADRASLKDKLSKRKIIAPKSPAAALRQMKAHEKGQSTPQEKPKSDKLGLGPFERFNVEFGKSEQEDAANMQFLHQKFGWTLKSLRHAINHYHLPEVDTSEVFAKDDIIKAGTILGNVGWLKRSQIDAKLKVVTMYGTKESDKAWASNNLPVLYIDDILDEPAPKYRVRRFTQAEKLQMMTTKDLTPLKAEWNKQTIYDLEFADPSKHTPVQDKEMMDFGWEIAKTDPRLRHTILPEYTNGLNSRNEKHMQARLDYKMDLSRRDTFWNDFIRSIEDTNRTLGKVFKHMDIMRKRSEMHWDDYVRVQLRVRDTNVVEKPAVAVAEARVVAEKVHSETVRKTTTNQLLPVAPKEKAPEPIVEKEAVAHESDKTTEKAITQTSDKTSTAEHTTGQASATTSKKVSVEEQEEINQIYSDALRKMKERDEANKLASIPESDNEPEEPLPPKTVLDTAADESFQSRDGSDFEEGTKGYPGSLDQCHASAKKLEGRVLKEHPPVRIFGAAVQSTKRQSNVAFAEELEDVRYLSSPEPSGRKARKTNRGHRSHAIPRPILRKPDERHDAMTELQNNNFNFNFADDSDDDEEEAGDDVDLSSPSSIVKNNRAIKFTTAERVPTPYKKGAPMPSDRAAAAKRKYDSYRYQDSLVEVPKDWRLTNSGTFSAWEEDAADQGVFMEDLIVGGKLPKGMGDWEDELKSGRPRKRVKIIRDNTIQDFFVYDLDGTLRTGDWKPPAPKEPVVDQSKSSEKTASKEATQFAIENESSAANASSDRFKVPEKPDPKKATGKASRIPPPEEVEKNMYDILAGRPLTRSSSDAGDKARGKTRQSSSLPEITDELRGESSSSSVDFTANSKLPDVGAAMRSFSKPKQAVVANEEDSLPSPAMSMDGASDERSTPAQKTTSPRKPFQEFDLNTMFSQPKSSGTTPFVFGSTGSTSSPSRSVFPPSISRTSSLVKDASKGPLSPPLSNDDELSGKEDHAPGAKAKARLTSLFQPMGSVDFGKSSKTPFTLAQDPEVEEASKAEKSMAAPSIFAAPTQNTGSTPFVFGSFASDGTAASSVATDSQSQEATNVLQPVDSGAILQRQNSALDIPKSKESTQGLMPSPVITTAPAPPLEGITAAEMGMFGGVKDSPAGKRVFVEDDSGMEIDNTPQSVKRIRSPKDFRAAASASTSMADGFKPIIPASFDFGSMNSKPLFGSVSSGENNIIAANAITSAPAPFTFGATPAAAPAEPVKFGAGPSTTSTFGNSTATQFQFGASSATAMPSIFGTSNAKTEPTPFAFGNTATTSAPSSNMFGATTSAPSNIFGPTTSAPSSNLFGATSSAPSAGIFGASVVAAPLFGAQPAATTSSSFTFGSTATAAPSIFSSAPTQNPVSSSSFTFGSTATEKPAMQFGGELVKPATSFSGSFTAPSSVFNFGSQPASPAPQAVPAPIFGASVTAAPSAPTTSTSFGGFGAQTPQADPAQAGIDFGFQAKTAGGTVGRNIKKPVSRLAKGGSLRR